MLFQNLRNLMENLWKIRMKTLMNRQKIIGINETLEKSIWQWYFDRGIPEPNWKVQKDPQWWIDYLKSLE